MLQGCAPSMPVGCTDVQLFLSGVQAVSLAVAWARWPVYSAATTCFNGTRSCHVVDATGR